MFSTSFGRFEDLLDFRTEPERLRSEACLRMDAERRTDDDLRLVDNRRTGADRLVATLRCRDPEFNRALFTLDDLARDNRRTEDDTRRDDSDLSAFLIAALNSAYPI